METKPKKLSYLSLLILALSHGIADFISAFILTKAAYNVSVTEISLLIIIYNILAFALQFPLGLIVDRIKPVKGCLILGLIFLGISLLLTNFSFFTAIILAGLGSCLFHVCGGRFSFNIMPQRAKSAGIFSAPGVIGLSLGGYIGLKGLTVTFPILIILFLLVTAIIYFKFSETEMAGNSIPVKPGEGLILLLFTAIALRSAVWDIYQIIYYGNYEQLLWLGLAAGAGKAAGGIAADLIGWKTYSITALVISSAILTFSKNDLLPLMVGIALLQSVTGIGAAAMYFLMPKKPATAAGLAFGLSIATGGLPFFLGIDGRKISPYTIALILTIVIFLFVQVLNPQNEENLTGQEA